MKKLHDNTDGFSAIEVLLAIVTLAVIGAAGYFVAYHQYHKTATATNRTAPSTTKTSTAPSTTTTQTKTPPQYLSIPELGLKFPIPPKDSDVTYTYQSGTATLHSASLLAYLKQYDPSCVPSSSSSKPQDWAGFIETTQPINKPTATVVVSGKSYYFEGHQQGCSVDAASNYIIASDSAIKSALSQAVPIN
ncbi:MAG: hypothetical protein NVSMB46_01900 [Candidatus Saccharimonadales bacterium]